MADEPRWTWTRHGPAGDGQSVQGSRGAPFSSAQGRADPTNLDGSESRISGHTRADLNRFVDEAAEESRRSQSNSRAPPPPPHPQGTTAAATEGLGHQHQSQLGSNARVMTPPGQATGGQQQTPGGSDNRQDAQQSSFTPITPADNLAQAQAFLTAIQTLQASIGGSPQRTLQFSGGSGTTPTQQPQTRPPEAPVDDAALEAEAQRLTIGLPTEYVQHQYLFGNHVGTVIPRLKYGPNDADVDDHRRAMHENSRWIPDPNARRWLSHGMISHKMLATLQGRNTGVYFEQCEHPDISSFTAEQLEQLSLSSITISADAHAWEGWITWLAGIRTTGAETFILAGLQGQLRLVELPAPKQAAHVPVSKVQVLTARQKHLAVALESIQAPTRLSALKVYSRRFANTAMAKRTLYFIYVNDAETFESSLRRHLIDSLPAGTRERIQEWIVAESTASGTVDTGDESLRMPSVWEIIIRLSELDKTEVTDIRAQLSFSKHVHGPAKGMAVESRSVERVIDERAALFKIVFGVARLAEHSGCCCYRAHDPDVGP
jgi:hypothetical protein